jgi:CRISPR system Cascade subunit CasA
VAASFSLITQPWIQIVDREGCHRSVGIAEAITDAHRISAVVAEAPVIVLAVRRLLVAVLHAALDGPRDRRQWLAVWNRGEFPKEVIEKYVAGRVDRFDLFGDRPFFQCPQLAEDLHKPAHLLRWVQENNSTLFDHATTARVECLEPAAAARWLVAQQAFDVGGIKTAFEGGRDYALAAPLAGSVVVQPTGATLFETLMLNLVRVDPDAEVPFPAQGMGTPVWDREPPDPAPLERHPDGYVDWLTWPSRRIRLLLDDEGLVDRVVLTPGDRPGVGTHQEQTEQFVAFEVDGSKGGNGWKPMSLRPERAVWRSYADLLRPKGPGATSRRPRVLDWLDDLHKDDNLSETRLVLEVGGLATERSKIHLWRLERHPVPPRVLAKPDLVEFLNDALELADGTRNALRSAFNYKYPHGAVPKPGEVEPFGPGIAARVETAFWASAGTGFDQLISGLEADRPGAARLWRDHLRQSALQAADPYLDGGESRYLARVSHTERILFALLKHHFTAYEDALEALNGEEGP